MKTKNKWRYVMQILIMITAVVSLYLLFNASPLTKGASSIGIIGGADGPTAIFLVGKPTDMLKLPFLILTILALAYMSYKRLRRSK